MTFAWKDMIMTTPNTIANFNGQRPIIDPDDAAMLLIDHQSGLFQTIGDMPMPALRNHAAALAKMASLCKIRDHDRLGAAGSERPVNSGNPHERTARQVCGPQGGD